MSLFEDTNPRPLKELLLEIRSKTMALPDFQREFVWDASATQELIVSIACNYPAGSVLRVRDTKRVFAAREFEGAPALNGQKHTFLVLDGQQRLTSLYQAFFGVGQHRYYLDIEKLMEGKDFEDAIFHLRATTKSATEYSDFKVQAKKLVLPLSILGSGPGNFGQWAKKTRKLLEAEYPDLEDKLDAIEEKWINTIDAYRFPVVTLSDTTEPAALCTIFETLNRTGVKLSPFELLTARFWPLKVNLRDLWKETCDQYPIIQEYDVDPYYLLQSIALVARKSPGCKRGDVMELPASDIPKWWNKVATGTAQGLSILREDCKVVLPKWLPYQTMIIPLAAVLARVGNPKSAQAGAQREKLKRWFWCAVFGQAYESHGNSQAAKDFSELVAWLGGGHRPESVKLLRFDPKALRDVTPRQRAIYRGVICLILGTGTGARDFHTQAIISGKLMLDEGIDDHHIFPSDFLSKKKGITVSRLRDCVLNRTLIDRTTNQLISNRAPSDYLKEIQKTKNFPFEKILSSHCLPAGKDSPFWKDNYEAFLDWRQERLWQAIKDATDLKEAADLEEADSE